jgi:hypothetical protein
MEGDQNSTYLDGYIVLISVSCDGYDEYVFGGGSRLMIDVGMEE